MIRCVLLLCIATVQVVARDSTAADVTQETVPLTGTTDTVIAADRSPGPAEQESVGPEGAAPEAAGPEQMPSEASVGREVTEQEQVSSATPVRQEAARTAVEIPGGVLFGKFAEEDGPFLLTGSVIVPSGQTLEFGPGVEIYVGGKYTTITVFGRILAKGTPEAPIVFQSANENPNPWDWDRIYCRSRSRSVFENCIVRHSNYGIFVENGAVSIERCTFERNSLHGLVVKNSDVRISKSRFRGGHVLALLCQAGAGVRAESLWVADNITGVACEDKARFDLRGGVIKKNKNGMAVRGGASVNIVAADITQNRIGVAVEKEIPRNMAEMVYKNGLNFQIVDSGEMTELLKPPEGVKSIVLPKTRTAIHISDEFKAGFAALQAPREATASFVGNVGFGMKYYRPDSHHHPKDTDSSGRGDTTYYQTRYLGEQRIVQGKDSYWYDGLQPEVTFFAQGKRDAMDVNLNGDLYYNSWVEGQTLIDGLGKNSLNLSVNYGDHALQFGDFYESISETSMSGRKITGFKYNAGFVEMGRGNKRIEVKLLGGESEAPRDAGDNDQYRPGEAIDSGMALRQQLTYVAHVGIRPTLNSSIGVRGIIAHDQDRESLFGAMLRDTGAPRPVSAYTGCIEGRVVFLDGKLEVGAELDMGTHDTVESQDYDDLAWYRPHMGEAVANVFRAIRPDSNNYALALDVQGLFEGYDLRAAYMEIAERFFSAGNPYIEPDRRVVTLCGEKQFTEQWFGSAGYEFEQRSASNTLPRDGEKPTFGNEFKLGVKYAFGEGLLTVKGDYTILLENGEEREELEYTEVAEGGTDEVEVRKMLDLNPFEIRTTLGLETQQRFSNGIDYSVKYRLVRDNDVTKYDVTTTGDAIPEFYRNEMKDMEDGWDHTVTGRFGFKIKRRLRNKTVVKVRFETEVDDSMESLEYKISDDLCFSIVPRKLTLNLKGEYGSECEERYETTDSGVPVYRKIDAMLAGIEATLKYVITSKWSVSLMGRYENSEDEGESSADNYTVIIGGFNMTYLF